MGDENSPLNIADAIDVLLISEETGNYFSQKTYGYMHELKARRTRAKFYYTIDTTTIREKGEKIKNYIVLWVEKKRKTHV